MRPATAIQLAALCLALVFELADWRWFQPDPQSGPDLFTLNNSQVYPTALTARARLQECIEAPPTPSVQLPTLFVGFARPSDCVTRAPDEPPIARLADVDPVYGFMSLQC
jgi:hypothetical protein